MTYIRLSNSDIRRVPKPMLTIETRPGAEEKTSEVLLIREREENARRLGIPLNDFLSRKTI